MLRCGWELQRNALKLLLETCTVLSLRRCSREQICRARYGIIAMRPQSHLQCLLQNMQNVQMVLLRLFEAYLQRHNMPSGVTTTLHVERLENALQELGPSDCRESQGMRILAIV